ncbi:Crp/Fnr family transcriptional regulator [Photobacterium sp. TY1-4]|uniref:Crp/Fnr family transcriptional regulator n=1 Tax=Photobacterium sp. TY1-4 TaxID=2899122 RepID=UPI0021C1F476|nr:Crp/Fnr family transcriptional regulator [Photobacterium sp. TY1-4]UXI02605.1 Crp/Fnr family transcriptional regulator [Photobacterium sp. TY1-4]
MDRHHQTLLEHTFSAVSPLSQAEFQAALPLFTFRHYAPKTDIFTAGDLVREIHFLLDGIGRYFYIDASGTERNKSLVRKGGAFASVTSLVEGHGSPFYTQTITDCTVASINYLSLIELSEQHHAWSVFLRRIYERLVLKKEKREADFLLLGARQRYEQFLNEFGEDSARIPLRHVAMYLGVTDVTLSRIRREMNLTAQGLNIS